MIRHNALGEVTCSGTTRSQDKVARVGSKVNVSRSNRGCLLGVSILSTIKLTFDV